MLKIFIRNNRMIKKEEEKNFLIKERVNHPTATTIEGKI
jgi:hypothetical protein